MASPENLARSNEQDNPAAPISEPDVAEEFDDTDWQDFLTYGLEVRS
jgi:hypothetical protein